jgi:hypothetical protein
VNEHFYSVTRKFIFHQFEALCAMVNLFKSDADIGLQLNTSLKMVTLRKMNYSESCI